MQLFTGACVCVCVCVGVGKMFVLAYIIHITASLMVTSGVAWEMLNVKVGSCRLS